MSPLFTLFLVTSFANIATPGIGAVMAVNLGLSQGWKRAIPGCLGIAIGIAFLFVIALSGTGAVLATHPAAFSVIQLIGAAFLAYLGIRSILKKPKHASLIGRHDEQTESGFSQFMKCAAISAANPQPIIFGLTVLPSFIDPTFSYVFQSAVMIVIYALIVFVMMMAYAILAAHARVFLSGPRGPRVINCISGVVFLFLAAFLLIERSRSELERSAQVAFFDQPRRKKFRLQYLIQFVGLLHTRARIEPNIQPIRDTKRK